MTKCFAFALIKTITSQRARTVIMGYPCLTPLETANDFLWHVGSAGTIRPYPQHATEGFFLSFVHEFRDYTYNMEAECFEKQHTACLQYRGKAVSISQARGYVDWRGNHHWQYAFLNLKRSLDKHQKTPPMYGRKQVFSKGERTGCPNHFLLSPDRYIN